MDKKVIIKLSFFIDLLYNYVGDNMIKENKITNTNLISALLFLFLGIILLTRWDLITIASKVIGIILIVFGITKIIIYIYMKGKLGNYRITDLITGLLIVSCGILLLTYSSALSFAIRTIIGLWSLFSGINRIIFAISVKSFDRVGFRVYLITSILMIIIGLCLISGLVDKIIGLFVIVYSIIEIVNYIYYKVKEKCLNLQLEPKKRKKKNKTKSIKEKKVVDAIIEE